MKTARTLFLGVLLAMLGFAPLFGVGVQYPSGELLRAPDGTFYGTSSEGGAFGSGTIFHITRDSELTLLLSFTGDTGPARGTQPRAGLLRDAAGNLWGTTQQGGISGKGTVFKFDPATNTLTTIIDFDGDNGANPQAALVADAAGLLWGTTAGGGANNLGTFFSLDPSNSALATVSFTGTAGAVIGSAPKGALFRDAAGIFWGTTSAGGTADLGTIFKYDPATPKFTSVVEFTGTSGAVPGAASVAALVDGGSGFLWGTADQGGTANLGTVFKFDTGNSALSTVVNFTGTNGQNPKGPLFRDGLGFFYGTASGGGDSAQGTVFKVNAATGTLTTVAHLTGTSGLAKGTAPLGGLVPDSLGSLWLTASQGGREDLGTIFKIDATNGLYTLLAEPNPVPSPPAATAQPPPGNTTTGPVGATVLLTGTAKDNVELLQVLVSLNGGPFVPAVLTAPAVDGKPFTWSLAVVPENGVNVVIVKSIDSGGDSSKPVTFSFNYTVLRPTHAGLYNGLSVPEATSPTPLQHSGSFSLKALPNGRFTGKMILGPPAVPLALTGSFGNDGTIRFGKKGLTSLVVLRKNLPALVLELALDVTDPLTRQITGTLHDNGVLVATLRGDQAIYTAKKNPLPPLAPVPVALLDPATDKGAYTAVLRALTPATQGLAAADFPQGDGYALGNVAKTGVVKFTGKLADGTPFSASSTLSQDGVVPLFVKLYGNTGAISGFITFADLGQSDAACLGLRWYKAPKANSPSYRGGWLAGIQIDFFASRFLKPSLSGATVIGNGPTADNALLSLTNASLVAVSNNLTIPLSGPVSVGAAVAGGGAGSLKISFAANGTFKGSYLEPLSGKVTPFLGAVLQKGQQASGYFLASPPPPPPGTRQTDPNSSGLVKITAQ